MEKRYLIISNFGSKTRYLLKRYKYKNYCYLNSPPTKALLKKEIPEDILKEYTFTLEEAKKEIKKYKRYYPRRFGKNNIEFFDKDLKPIRLNKYLTLLRELQKEK